MKIHTIFLALIVSFTFTFSSNLFSRDFGPSLNHARHGLDAIEYNGDIYAIGGWNGGDKLEVLYAGATSWTVLSPLPNLQMGVAAALVGDKIYAMGGYGPIDACNIYDITAGSWSAGPVLPRNMYWATAESVGDKIYLIGGHEPGGGGALDTLYILNTVTGIWSQGASIPMTMQIPSSAVFGNEIYIFGNYNRYYKYDIGANIWSPFTGPASNIGYGSEAVTVGDKIFLMGGSPGNIYTAYTNIEIYYPAYQTWTAGPDLMVGRYQFGAVHLPSNNYLYAVGGRDNTASSLDSVEIFDISEMEFFADIYEVSESVGGVINFTLNAGPSKANRNYLIVGGVTGTTPGINLPGGANLPINWDLITNVIMELTNTPIFNNFYGTLDNNGTGAAMLDTLGSLPTGAAGVVLSFAYACPIPPSGWFASNAVNIEIVP